MSMHARIILDMKVTCKHVDNDCMQFFESNHVYALNVIWFSVHFYQMVNHIVNFYSYWYKLISVTW